jgi:hypothetical protein
MVNRRVKRRFPLKISHFIEKIVQSSDFCPLKFVISTKSYKVAILEHNRPGRMQVDADRSGGSA